VVLSTGDFDYWDACECRNKLGFEVMWARHLDHAGVIKETQGWVVIASDHFYSWQRGNKLEHRYVLGVRIFCSFAVEFRPRDEHLARAGKGGVVRAAWNLFGGDVL
jgi:hypothetical protein